MVTEHKLSFYRSSAAFLRHSVSILCLSGLHFPEYWLGAYLGINYRAPLILKRGYTEEHVRRFINEYLWAGNILFVPP
jgi:hypothetical protein